MSISALIAEIEAGIGPQTPPPVCVITYSAQWEEYRVPHPCGREAAAYYTDSRADACGTARAMWGAAVILKIRRAKEST